MPRKLRIQYPGAIYHVMSRGDRRDKIRQSGEIRAERMPGKLAMASRLRRETTLTVKWIAARVKLGTSKGANRNLHHWMKNHPVSAVNPPSARQNPEDSLHEK